MKHILFIVIISSSLQIYGQSTDIIINSESIRLLSKSWTKSGSQFFNSFKPYKRVKSVELISDLPNWDNEIDRFNNGYLLVDNREFVNDTIGLSKKPFLKKLYTYQNDFYSYAEEDFNFHINPVWQLSFGKDSRLDRLLFVNSRGIEFRGNFEKVVSFYSYFTENQTEYPSYIKEVADSVGLIPYEGFWKEYNISTTDYLRTIGYIDLTFTKFMSTQIGYGRHFIGYGDRSLFLSDFSNSYPYLRHTIEFWKVKYSSIFAKLTAEVSTYDGGNLGATDYPNKYMNSHYVDISILPNLNVGIFESVIYGKPDSLSGSHPKIEYMIPFLFLRGVEQQDGSGDNSILGIESSWNIWRKWQLYGQFILDDFSISETKSWWGNKYGYQIGSRFYDLMVNNLDLQLEFNTARPFLYSHQDYYTSYTHYNQPLAHPLGANFSEVIAQLTYQPIPRLVSKFAMLNALYGNDTDQTFSYGRDPLKTYNLRNGEYGHTIGQGDKTTLFLTQVSIAFQIKHNFFLDLAYTYRNETSESKSTSWNSSNINAGFRWNSTLRNYLF